MNQKSVVGFLLFLLPFSVGGCQPPDSDLADRPIEPRLSGPPSEAQSSSEVHRTIGFKSTANTERGGEVQGLKATIDSELTPDPFLGFKQAVTTAEGITIEPKSGDGVDARPDVVLPTSSAVPMVPGTNGGKDREVEALTKFGQNSTDKDNAGNGGRGGVENSDSPAALPHQLEKPSQNSGSFSPGEFSQSPAVPLSPTGIVNARDGNEGAAVQSSVSPPREGESESVVPAVQLPPLNSLLLNVLKTMPEGGGYSVSGMAASNLASSIAVNAKTGNLRIEAGKAQPSFCSGATYVALLSLLSELQEKHRLEISPEAVDALLMKRQADGVGVWGRWNSNGPGTAKLFADLGIGKNFTDIATAMPGDFMKIWWNEGIGSTERGHSVVFLGVGRYESGEEWVKFWSSNQDVGYSEKVINRSKIVRVLFSRLEDPSRINLVTTLPGKDEYLSTLLNRPSSESEMFDLCRVDAAPKSSLLKGGSTNAEIPASPPLNSTDQMLVRVFGELFAETNYVGYAVKAQVELLRRIQRSLVASGDYKDEPDGLPGPMTRQAISAWQERMQLKSSGAMDSASLKSMGLDELSESELLSGAGEKSE